MQSGRWAEGALAQITTADFDVAIVGQLPATDLPLGDEFEPGPMQMVGFEATLGRRGLEHAPRHPHYAVILADADAKDDAAPI